MTEQFSTRTEVALTSGLASLALGFGTQNLARDLINGFFIILKDQYGVGDTIRIGDVQGRVEHLTFAAPHGSPQSRMNRRSMAANSRRERSWEK